MIVAKKAIPPPKYVVEVDERWIADWIAYGLKELGAYLERHAEFDEYLATHQRPEE